MPRNVEIKARIEDRDALIQRVERVATSGPTEIRQDDTFFRVPKGRLKLREFGDGTGVLVFYERPDDEGPKASSYILSTTAEPETLRQALSLACGVLGRVRKQRTLYFSGRTRIHLDRVDELGDFLELEVVLGDAEDTDAGIHEARRIMAALAIAEEMLASGAYLDLLAAARAAPR